MKYTDYIELGFIRHDLNDEVEFINTGYHGFVLYKEIDNEFMLEVGWNDLDDCKLYHNQQNPIAVSEDKLKEILNTPPMEKTPVEWLADKYNYVELQRKKDEISHNAAHELKRKYLEAAKKMEKKMLENARTS